MNENSRIFLSCRGAGFPVALVTALLFPGLEKAPLSVGTSCRAAQAYVRTDYRVPVSWQQDVIEVRKKGYELLRNLGLTSPFFDMLPRYYFCIMGPLILEKVGPQGEALAFNCPDWLDPKHVPTILRYFPEVEILIISVPAIDESIADAIANHLPGLTKVRLGGNGVSDYTLKSLAKLKHLEIFSIGPGSITAQGLAYLPEYPSLKYFCISPVYDRIVPGLKHLTRCRNLEALWLGFLGRESPPPEGAPPPPPPVPGKAPVKQLVSPEVAETLAKIPRLKYLCLPFSLIDDNFVRELSKSQTIVYLDLGLCADLTDKSAEYLSQMKQLEVLDLCFCKQLTDESVKHLTRLPRLRGLSLGAVPKITDASVPFFCQMKNLQYLSIDGTVSVAGGDQIIRALAPHKLIHFDGKWSNPKRGWYRPDDYRKPN